MNLSSRAKMVMLAVGLAVVLAYLAVIDLGVYAGRVHAGVAVAGHDVGGLTFPELVDELEQRRDELMDRTFTVTAGGATEQITPGELGWNPQPFETALAIFEVGRGDVWSAIGDRVAGWVGGVDVEWEGGVRSNRVARLIHRLEAAGVDVDDSAARAAIRRAVATDGSLEVEVPVEG